MRVPSGLPRRCGVAESKVISRRFFSDGREEVMQDEHGDRRLVRWFRTGASPGQVADWFGFITALDIPGIAVPDRFEQSGPGRFCFSMDASGFEGASSKPSSIGFVREKLSDLHEAGFLHLDLASMPFVRRNGKDILLYWGDSSLQPNLQDHAPEILSGAFATPASDYHGLGRLAASMPNQVLRLGGLGSVEGLQSHSPARRTAAAAELGFAVSGSVQKNLPNLPRSGVVAITGGRLQIRDQIVNEWVCMARSRGWLTRVVRCSPWERRRPLPDRPLPGPRIRSAADLMSSLFPGTSGVNRLLVIDSPLHASRDLGEALKELAEVLPPRLCLVLSSGTPVEWLETGDLHHVDLTGQAEESADLPCGIPGASGWPGPSWLGARRRGIMTGGEPEMPVEPQTLLSEGAFRELAAAWDSGEPGRPDSTTAAECFLELGFPERSLELLAADAGELRARASIQLGMNREAEAALRALGQRRTQAGDLLLADILISDARFDEALEVLGEAAEFGRIERRARILDLLGRPSQALELIDSELPAASERGRADLLCTKSTLMMRLGFYEDALKAADEAVNVSRSAADLAALTRSLQERGRVREVTGAWREALDDCRMAVFHCEENGLRFARPPHIDCFVLATRMGLLSESEALWRTIPAVMGRTEASSGPGRLTLDMLEACAGTLLGRGARAMAAAERGAAAAASMSMPLRQGLCLLYRGILMMQEGEMEEAVQSLRHARSIAGLLGDRHLELLADLAQAQAGLPVETARITALASDLGLAAEVLESRSLPAVEPGERAEALGALLDLPSPLRACELASLSPEMLPERLLTRLSRTRDELLSVMSDEDAESFRALTRGLDAARGTGRPFVTGGQAVETLRSFSSWALGFSRGIEDLSGLARITGADEISAEGDGEIIADSPVPLRASGGDLGLARALGPAAAVIAASVPRRGEPGAAGDDDPFPEIAGSSPAVIRLKEEMAKAAPLSLPILITGETGTGKDLVARGIHRRSRSAHGPFVPVDCGAIPETLLESELFGARRGAYTDLRADRSGLVESASGGTLFLDEMGNLAQAMQVKLLRVLETGRFRRLGDSAEQEVAFRLLAATNSDLSSAVAAGRFRADLYYRLAVVVIRTPSLRERLQDIPDLARRFVVEMRSAEAGDPPSVTAGALRRLAMHSWPGNVRELRNVIQRAVLLSDGRLITEREIVFEDIPVNPILPRLESIEDAVARHVHLVLESVAGNRARAAEILECDPKTLRKYLSLYESRFGNPSRGSARELPGL